MLHHKQWAAFHTGKTYMPVTYDVQQQIQQQCQATQPALNTVLPHWCKFAACTSVKIDTDLPTSIGSVQSILREQQVRQGLCMHPLLRDRGSEDHVGMGDRGGYQVQVVEVEAAVADFVSV